MFPTTVRRWQHANATHAGCAFSTRRPRFPGEQLRVPDLVARRTSAGNHTTRYPPGRHGKRSRTIAATVKNAARAVRRTRRPTVATCTERCIVSGRMATGCARTPDERSSFAQRHRVRPPLRSRNLCDDEPLRKLNTCAPVHTRARVRVVSYLHRVVMDPLIASATRSSKGVTTSPLPTAHQSRYRTLAAPVVVASGGGSDEGGGGSSKLIPSETT